MTVVGDETSVSTVERRARSSIGSPNAGTTRSRRMPVTCAPRIEAWSRVNGGDSVAEALRMESGKRQDPNELESVILDAFPMRVENEVTHLHQAAPGHTRRDVTRRPEPSQERGTSCPQGRSARAVALTMNGPRSGLLPIQGR